MHNSLTCREVEAKTKARASTLCSEDNRAHESNNNNDDDDDDDDDNDDND